MSPFHSTMCQHALSLYLQVSVEVKELFHNLVAKLKQDKARHQKKEAERAEAEDLLKSGERKKPRQLTLGECKEKKQDENVRIAYLV